MKLFCLRSWVDRAVLSERRSSAKLDGPEMGSVWLPRLGVGEPEPLSQRFIRCQHCGLPHNLTDEVCPVTGKSMRERGERQEKARAGSSKKDAAGQEAPIPLVIQRPARSDPRRPGHSVSPASKGGGDHGIIGRVIGDKYRVVGLVGEGGMGTVYEAEHLDIGRRVAVKVLNRAHLGRKEAVARFHREARAAGAIGHPNICEIYDVGRLSDGSPYLVMERLHGQTLADRINIEGALPFEDVVGTLTQVLSALVAAHQKGIIHRDVKPENIFLTERVGCAAAVKILDFGISKSSDDRESLSLTRTGMVMGTPFYMAPEQVRGEDIDHRVDIYACGVILYETLTGRRPFIASNYNALVIQVLSTEPRDPREIRPAIPDSFVPIVYKALAKRREDRFDDAASFIDALTTVQSDLGRGPTHAEIKKLAEEVRRNSRPPPALLPPESPISDSIDIPVVFSDTATGQQAVSLATGDVEVNFDTGSHPGEEDPTMVGEDLPFARASNPMGDAASSDPSTDPNSEANRHEDGRGDDRGNAVEKRVAGREQVAGHEQVVGDEEVNDTIVDPTGAMLGELWSQLDRVEQHGNATAVAADADATARTDRLDRERAESLVGLLDDPDGGTTDADEVDEDGKVKHGRYSVVSSFPEKREADTRDTLSTGPDSPPDTSITAPSQPHVPTQPRAQVQPQTHPEAHPETEPQPQTVPRVPRPSAQPPRPTGTDAPRAPGQASARKQTQVALPPPAPGREPSSGETSEPDDDAVTTLFISSDDGPREASASREGGARPDNPRPPSTPDL